MVVLDAPGRVGLLALSLLPALACSGGEDQAASSEAAAPREAAAPGKHGEKNGEAKPPAAAGGPVSLRSLQGSLGKPGTGQGHVLKIKADYQVGAELPKRSGLHAKVTCDEGGGPVSDVVSLASYHADFREMKAGDHKKVDTAAFWLGGLLTEPAACQFDLVYSVGKKEKTEIGSWCWTKGGTEKGACKGLAAPRIPKQPVLADGFDIQAESSVDGDGNASHGVAARARVRFAETPDKTPNLTLRTACTVGERTYVDVAPNWPRVKPFGITPGEDLLVAAGLYRLHGLPGPAQSCDVSAWRDTAWNQPDLLAGRVCWDGTGTTPGPCKPAEEATPVALSEATASLERATLKIQDDSRDPTLKLARFDFEVDVAQAVDKGTRLDVSSVCDGKEQKPTIVGPDLSRVEPGQTVRLSLTAYVAQPLSKAPDECTLKLTAKKLGGEERVVIGEQCVPTEGQPKPGACD